MAIDGKILARARARLNARRTENEAETNRRREEVYARVPRIAELDAQLRRLVTRVVGMALRRGEDTQAAVAGVAEESLRLQRERAELLVRAGYAEDYLDDIYTCTECKDTGFVGGKMCQCLHRLYTEEQSRDLSDLIRLGSESFAHFDLNLYDDTTVVPEVGTTARQWMEQVLSFCRSYADRLGSSCQNLLFRGGTGLGKTFTSACIARRAAEQGISVVYRSISGALEPMEEIKFGRLGEDSTAFADRDRIMQSELLILDDLGTEMQTAFSVSALYTIVNTRLISGKKTVISTNLSSDQIRAAYGAQLASRLEGEYVSVLFVGSDIRLKKKEM
jgi:DNA replication protein DnaC